MQTVGVKPEDLREFAERSHARALGNFPSEGYLAEDFAHHLRLKELIDRASAKLRGR
jgi:hypothetical protein